MNKKFFKGLGILGVTVLASLTLFACASDGVSSNSGSQSNSSQNNSSESSSAERVVYSVSEALNLFEEENDWQSSERYYVKGIIKSITNPTYGAMILEDDTSTISVYGSYSADGEKRYSELTEKPVAGDEVLLYSKLKYFNGTKEINSGWIIEFTHNKPAVDEKDYTSMTVATARTAAKDSKVKLTGVVAAITYATGKIPSGFELVDNTGSIYVYDTQIAPQVSVGNKVTILGEKTYYILDTEVTHAEKFGYTGSCQIQKAYLIANDKGETSYDKSWIEEKTVKEVLKTPFTENITNLIYKATAQIKKVPGDGFINYYINDLDGTTGTYVYTQCNGSDFTWLDAFDGKICTVYFTIINAKATATGCNWRVIPITVTDDKYTFDTTKTPDFVLDYYAKDQFQSEYSGDPKTKLVTNVDSELLGFTGANISYSSSNTSVVYFEEIEGETYLRTKESGTATITITATYLTYTKSIELTIVNTKAEEVEALTVAEALAKPKGTEVTVMGIVSASVVNQKAGFYLIDETGAVAVRMTDASVLENLELGNRVAIKGTKTDEVNSKVGQTCILDATLVANYYSKTDYSTASFDRTKTVADLIEFDKADTSNTAKVFIVEATIAKNSGGFSTTYDVVAGDAKLQLYSGSGSQYSWLEPFAGKTVTVEVALCNWNGKALKGCVLAVIDNGVKTVNSINFI